LRPYWINSREGRGNLAVPSATDKRMIELQQLKLALTTFALQLDAFELRAKEALQPFSRDEDSFHRLPLQEDRKIVGH
jgi:hypothetical protein